MRKSSYVQRTRHSHAISSTFSDFFNLLGVIVYEAEGSQAGSLGYSYFLTMTSVILIALSHFCAITVCASKGD
jgi:hypothetical protein